MGEIHDLGTEFILWVQRFHSPGATSLWKVFTNFGGTYYVGMIPALLWCVDYRTGLRVLAVFTATIVLNTALKEWFAQPRPYQWDFRVDSPGEQGYGLPSGHAQLAVVFWGVIASWVDRVGFWWFAIAMMFLIGFSRVAIAVHFPSDVLLGWALGALTLWLYLRYGSGVEAWRTRYPLAGQVGWALTAGAVVFVFVQLVPGGQSPMNAGAAGLIAGGGLGAAVGLRALSFTGRGSVLQRVLPFTVGMLVMLPLMGAMQRIGMPDGGLGRLVIVVDLAVIGLWLTLGAPWLFEKLRLSVPSNA